MSSLSKSKQGIIERCFAKFMRLKRWKCLDGNFAQLVLQFCRRIKQEKLEDDALLQLQEKCKSALLQFKSTNSIIKKKNQLTTFTSFKGR